jgi:hypothetical protein
MTGAQAAAHAIAGDLAHALALEPLDPIVAELERARCDLLELAVLRAELARVREGRK